MSVPAPTSNPTTTTPVLPQLCQSTGCSSYSYIAGALHAHTGRLVRVEHHRKTSALILKLFEQIRCQYRRAKRIVLILDNYGIHKSRGTQRWLAENPKFQLLFQPTYYSWVNVIERLWKAMHDTVTRNHRCRSMFESCQSVARFLAVVQPFPGNGHGVAHLGSGIWVSEGAGNLYSNRKRRTSNRGELERRVDGNARTAGWNNWKLLHYI